MRQLSSFVWSRGNARASSALCPPDCLTNLSILLFSPAAVDCVLNLPQRHFSIIDKYSSIELYGHAFTCAWGAWLR